LQGHAVALAFEGAPHVQGQATASAQPAESTQMSYGPTSTMTEHNVTCARCWMCVGVCGREFLWPRLCIVHPSLFVLQHICLNVSSVRVDVVCCLECASWYAIAMCLLWCECVCVCVWPGVVPMLTLCALRLAGGCMCVHLCRGACVVAHCELPHAKCGSMHNHLPASAAAGGVPNNRNRRRHDPGSQQDNPASSVC
jgi:hypothetical protein